MKSRDAEKSFRRSLKNWSLKKMMRTKVLIFILFVLSVGPALGITLLHASTGGGDPEAGRNWVGFGWRAFNFIVLAGLLYWLMADKVRDFFSSRQDDVKTTLQGLAVAKEEAEKKFAEYNARLDKATDEIQAMADLIRQQGLAEKDRIIADAERAAVKMKDDASKRMDHEMKMARHDLREEAVRLSVQMAQDTLKQNITATDHAAMVGDYIDKVVSKH
jgi:F-type H+-transporting ATPase subunit b